MSKRILDIVVACLLLPLCALLIPVMWLGARVEKYPSVFYRQDRVGAHGKIIQVLKFRTMGTPASSLPSRSSFYLVRALGLDELPQISHVIRGQMSLVGPRPLIRRELFQCPALPGTSLAEAIRSRQLVKPGITGLSQISLRDRKRSGGLFWDMLDLDLWYIKNRTALLDLMILSFTPLYLMSAGRLLFPTRRVGYKGFSSFHSHNSIAATASPDDPVCHTTRSRLDRDPLTTFTLRDAKSVDWGNAAK